MKSAHAVDRVGEILDQFEMSPVRTKTILIVGPHGSGKTKVLQDIAETKGFTRINVNLEVGKRLLEVPEKRRAFKLESVLDAIIEENGKGQSTVLLDNIELLFSPELQVDPLHILENIGRTQPVVVSWPGSSANGALTYAEPGHPEYRIYREFDSYIVNMEE